MDKINISGLTVSQRCVMNTNMKNYCRMGQLKLSIFEVLKSKFGKSLELDDFYFFFIYLMNKPQQ